ncbi:MAG: FAD-binding protein, partial [Candidatus Cloacimonetes bacterium]|nr:FAD-binding protein [Candidatus Cloacimonadota bacterium]
RYGNLFHMYNKITDEDPYKHPMRIYPAVHYTMGGLWVDYNLQSTIPGLFVLGEANFSDHGANRLGASALMQGLADGYFVAPYTIGNYLAGHKPDGMGDDVPEAKESRRMVTDRSDKLLSVNGSRTVDDLHRELGKMMWDHCGMARNEEGLKKLLAWIPQARERFWKEVKVLGTGEGLNQNLEKAGRVADFYEFSELMARDALERRESCGVHFREESQTEEGEAKRDDENFAHGAVWEFKGVGEEPVRHREELSFEHCKPSQRSYK